MDFTKALKKSVHLQDINLNVEEIPFNIYLKNNSDILTLCFLEYESEDFLIIAETTIHGSEEMRIIPKKNVEYISLFYDYTILTNHVEDNMFM